MGLGMRYGVVGANIYNVQAMVILYGYHAGLRSEGYGSKDEYAK